jgi:hypothetical protein
MENLLSGFQGDLGKLSSEIQSLQDQSFDMSIRLKNRLVCHCCDLNLNDHQLIKQQLGIVLDGIVIPPEIIKCAFAKI